MSIVAIQTASAITLQSTYGYWSDAGPGTPTCLWPSPLTSTSTVVRYGNPNYYGSCPSQHSSQSGFGFLGVGTSAITPGTEFPVGTFTHYNEPIYASNPFQYATLNIEMTFQSTPSPVSQTFNYQVTLDETTNHDCPDSCPYMDKPGWTCSDSSCPSGGGKCPDYVTVPSTFVERTITLNGQDYTLQITGFKKSGETQIRSYFITQENCQNAAVLWAKLILLNPQIRIEKKLNGNHYSSAPGTSIPVGCPINWTYNVTNPGNVPLSGVTVTDSDVTVPSSHTGDTNNDGKLDPGEIWIYKASSVAAAGSHSNKATAAGSFASRTVTYDDWSYYTGCTPVIAVTPAALTVCEGTATAVLNAESTGCSSCTEPAYKWYKGSSILSDEEKYSGTTTSHLTIHNAVPADSGTYKAVATCYSGCTGFFGTAIVTVQPKPDVLAGEDQIICPEINATLIGTATNYSSVQWSIKTGSGILTPDPADQKKATYSPAGGETSAILTFKADPIAPCTETVSDDVTITIQDNVKPVITCPQDATIECWESLDPKINPKLGNATATDDCDSNLDISYEDVEAGNCPKIITRTWKASDSFGNFATCTQIITVQDTTAPILEDVPADITVECDSVPPAATVTAKDSCGESVEVALKETTSPGDCPGNYTLTRTWTAIDDCGNSASASQVITVQDTTAPSLSGVPADVTVECDSVPDAATVIATDNCDTSPEISLEETTEPGDCPGNYTLTRTWTATDDCGNSESARQVITVQDTTEPTLSGIPNDVTVECNSVPTAATVTATDNCDESPEVTLKETTTPGNCPGNYTLIRTWTATDDCGNAASASQVITVHDTSAPTLSGIPEDITVQCDSVPDAATVTATDNCDPSPEVTLKETAEPENCPGNYTLTRTWTATDDCGNSASASQVITVRDTKPPVLDEVPADVTVECDSVPDAATVTATDNCDESPEVTLEETTTPGNCPGNYTLTRTWTATDACGNSASASQIITVRDTTPPTLSSVPNDVIVECDSVPVAATVTATDNCDESPEVALKETTSPGDCPGNYTLTRTWTATDDCGNAASASQIITVRDTLAPTLSGVPEDVTIECDSIPDAATVTATDNCDESPEVTLEETTTPGNCPSNYTLTRTWTATDDCGNSASASQVITVQDTIAPTLSDVPDDVTVECDSVPDAATLAATDNCDESPEVTLDETTEPGNCPGNYTLTRTWTATDGCGNSASASQIITVQDTTPPVLDEVPAEVTVECDSIPDAAMVTATDNCDESPQVTLRETTTPGNCPGNYTLTRTWTATDDCGNSASASQVITVQDTTAPTLSGVPEDVTVECNSVPAAATVTATDNCDDSPEVSLEEATRPGNCPGNYTLTRTWTATDACGNSALASQVITVQDTTAPVLSGVPDDTTAECDSVPTAATVTATDNCDESPEVTLEETTTPGNCPGNYTLTRTWTAIDECGNEASASQAITVQDTTAPILADVPDDITVECDSVPDATTVTATDNCDESPEVTLEETTTPGDCPGNYTLTRTWTATDDCGNAASASQVITVQDTTAPSLSGVPDDVTVECDSIPIAAAVTATDNCDKSPEVDLEETTTPGNCPGNYTLTRTWTAIDACGNSALASQVITVQDTTAPVLSGVPDDTTAECDSVPAAATVTATDNCDESPGVALKETTSPGDCPGNYTLTRTWTATDACGNSASASQIITVRDTIAPTLTDVPADITVECDSVPDATTVTATDNCDNSPEVTLEVTTTPGNCPGNYTLTRTWTTTDDCGNSASASQIITVRDTTPPTLSSVPNDVIVECDSVPSAATVTATDNCDESPEVDLEETTAPGDCPGNYTLTRTWTATDDCGNSASASQVITVQDTKPPVLDEVPADVTVECDSVPDTATVTATDNCDESPEVTLEETTTPGNCPGNYTLTRTWTATDACGNSASASQIITVRDTIAPTLTDVPADITVECDSVPAAATVTATDNCDESPEVTPEETTTPGDCSGNYTLTRTWIATDDCGNGVSASQVITVRDTSAPTLSGVPEDITVECDSVPSAATVTATDNCDESPEVTLEETTTPGNCPGNYTLIRTWTATDDCGNSDSASQVITIQDTIAPILTDVPGDVTVECDSVPLAATVTATDNCDVSPEVTLEETTTPGNCPGNYTLTRAWTATDACGNSALASQVITVQDTTAPVLSGVPDDTTAECDSIPTAATVIATDNCDESPEVALEEATTRGDCPGNYTLTRTWTATDDCGNSISASQVITVQDTTAPTLTNIPNDITVECDSVPTAAAITATDNCDESPKVTLDETTEPGDCPGNYTLIRTWTATDYCGNSASASQVITVRDTSAPTLSGIPKDVTVECDSVPSAATATARDNCDPSPEVTLKETTTPGDCPGNYTLTRTWTAIDECGNEASASQAITVQDTTAPILADVPDDITVECDSVPDATTVTATDNCDESPEVTLEETTTPGNCPGNYTLTRTWTTTDDCGNSASASQIITVRDTTPPTLSSVPNDVIVECDSVPSAATVTATDNCDVSPEVTLEETTTPGNCPGNYTLTRTWTATDACGNSALASQVITVQDTTAPVLSGVPDDTTAECDSVPAAATVTATDNCDESPEVTLEETTEPGNCPGNYTLTRTWTATDDCGNSASASQIITVQDTTAPALSDIPADITVECDSVPLAATVTATDNCDESPEVILEETTTPGDCPGNYTLTRTWTATDACGNSASASQTITVQDTTAPTLLGVPNDTTVECDTIPTAATVTATDNCDESPKITLVETTEPGDCPGNYTLTRTWVAVDACGNSASASQVITVQDSTAPILSGVPEDVTVECNLVPPAATVTAGDNCDESPEVTLKETTEPSNCPGNYTLTRIWTATDDCGNSESARQVITVQDTTEPTLSGIPNDVTVECNSVPTAATVTATDNCDESPEVTLKETTTPGNCPGNYTLIRTWTATDDCGNAASASQVITVRDTSAPTLSGIPEDITVQCDSVPDAATVTATDNCDPSPEVTLKETAEPENCPGNYTLTRTWTATDDCGNSASASQTISVQDTTPPTLSGVPEDVTVECNSVPAAATVTAIDNCDDSPKVSLEETTTPGNCPGNYTLTRTWTATDDCRNSASASQVITVQDTTPPVLDEVPADVTVECDSVPDEAIVTATDNCGASPEVTLEETTTPGDCPGNYTLTRTWTVTDACGNSASASQVITVRDTTAPILDDVPDDITVECDTIPTPATVTAADNCDESPKVTLDETTEPGDCPGNYTLIRTWTATDDCGNSASASQVITVRDTSAPTLFGVPKDVTLECDSVPLAATITARDNCDESPEVTLEETTTPGNCPGNYTLTRTWTATDDCGNAASASQVITVQDTTAPSLSGVPDDVTVECDSIPIAAAVTATDNCDKSPEVDLEETTAPGDCPGNYTLTRTWTATDACGNSASASQIITVRDTTPPTLSSVPNDVTVECDSVPSATTITATDNCDESPEVTLDETTEPGDCPGNYTLIRTWTATDDCGNSASASQTITVQDTTAPTLADIPADITVECDSVPTAATVTATDNCDESPKVTLVETNELGDCPGNFTLTRTWTAIDACGNSASASQIITVQDMSAPTLSGVPEDITVECDSVPDATIVTATDNCDESPEVALKETTTPGGCPGNYTLTRTWTATDDCGNSASASQIITVQDTIAPTLSDVPDDVTVECDSVPDAATLAATDNCDESPEVTLDETTEPGNCPGNYTLTRTWTATDDCGNRASASQVITVRDISAPTLSGVPEDVTVECDSVPDAATVTATDNCDEFPEVTLEETITPGNCPGNYTLTRTWTATDACGNSASASQVITVQDTTAPTLSDVPDNVTVECNSMPPAATITAKDNCDESPEVTLKETISSGDQPGNYTLTRTWTATDACGNSASASQIITVRDTTAPILSGVPEDVTVECNLVPPAATVTAEDNCDESPKVTLDETIAQGNCPGNYTLTRTWTATDAYGNSASANQVITVHDTTAPILLDVPYDLTAECDLVPSAATVTAKDNCDESPEIILNETMEPGSCPGNYTLTRTWTATDDCGNSASASQVITVQDTTAPILSGVPASVTVECDSVPPAAIVTATDNCDSNPTVDLKETIESGNCPGNYTLTRTWTAIDACGNSASASQVVTVQDTIKPTIACPPNIEVCTNPGESHVTVDLGNPIVNDNCSEVSVTNDAPEQFPIGETLVTWTVMDSCGNSNTCTQKVTVNGGISITTQPESQSFCQGDDATVTFSVQATGTSQIYQWQKDGMPLSNGGRFSGTDTAMLTITGVMPEDAGSYNVIISSDVGCGEAVSNQASLDVNEIPTCMINAPDLVCADSEENTASVNDAGDGATYDWSIKGGSIDSEEPYSNSIIWTAGSDDKATINVTVVTRNGCSASCSKSIALPHCVVPEPFSITGHKFNDLNGDGAWDKDTEPGLGGWKIILMVPNGSILESLTDSAGYYKFADLMDPGTYTVTEDSKPGWVLSYPAGGSYSFEIGEAGDRSKDYVDFGNMLPPSSISVKKEASESMVVITEEGSTPPTTTFTITVENNGESDLSSVTVVDNLPAGMIYISSNQPAGVPAAEVIGDGQVIEWDLGVLKPSDGPMILTIEAKVDEAICGLSSRRIPDSQEQEEQDLEETLRIMAATDRNEDQEKLIRKLSRNLTVLDLKLNSTRMQRDGFDKKHSRISTAALNLYGKNCTAISYYNATTGINLTEVYDDEGFLIRSDYHRKMQDDSLTTEYSHSGRAISELYTSRATRESLKVSYDTPSAGLTTFTVTYYPTGDTLIVIKDAAGTTLEMGYRKTPGLAVTPARLSNCVAVSGTDPSGAVVTDEDCAELDVICKSVNPQYPLLMLKKTPSVTIAKPGDTIIYTYEVQNMGMAPAFDVIVKDDKLGVINSDPISQLDPGEALSLTKAYVVKDSDLPGPIKNVALAEGEDQDGDPVVSPKVEAEVNLISEIARLIKTASPEMVRPGDYLTYNIVFITETSVKDVTITDTYPSAVSFISANPAPSQGNNVWKLGDLEPGRYEIDILVQVAEIVGDMDFNASNMVRGKGFTNVYSSVETKPVHLVNKAVAKYNEHESLTAYADVQVGPPETSTKMTEHGSGEYRTEDTLRLLQENRTIEWNNSLSAHYRPTTFKLPRNRSIDYRSSWAEKLDARNRGTMASISEEYTHATNIDRDSSLKMNENESVLATDTYFVGKGHIGVSKYSNSTEESQKIKNKGSNNSRIFESQEDYTGSFHVLQRIDEYGKNVNVEKSVSGQGMVSADSRIRSSQRTYEYGSGSYRSDQTIATVTGYMKKDIDVAQDPYSYEYSPGRRTDGDIKWKEGMWSKTKTSFIGEEYSSLDYLQKQTIVPDLGTMKTEAKFSGKAEFRVVNKYNDDNLSGEIDIDQELVGDYALKRKVVLTGISRYDYPHISLMKLGKTDLANSTFVDYQIFVQNDGNIALEPVYIVDQFPPGTDYVGSSYRPEELAQGYVNWTLPHLGIGQSVTIDLHLNITDKMPNLINRVLAQGRYGDQFTTARNFSTIQLEWLSCCPPQFDACKTAKIDPDEENVIWYNITLRNKEGYTMAVFVIDNIPSDISLLNSSLEPSSQNPGEIVWTITDLGPGERRDIVYRARAERNGEYANVAHIEAYSIDGPDYAKADVVSRVQIGGPDKAVAKISGWPLPSCFGLNCTSEFAGSDWISCYTCDPLEAQSQGVVPACSDCSSLGDDIP